MASTSQAYPHQTFSPELKERVRQYVDGELTHDQVNDLRRGLTSSMWLSVAQQRIDRDAKRAKEAKLVERTRLIDECLRPIDSNQGSQELIMRQIRLLAAILERLP